MWLLPIAPVPYLLDYETGLPREDATGRKRIQQEPGCYYDSPGGQQLWQGSEMNLDGQKQSKPNGFGATHNESSARGLRTDARTVVHSFPKV